MIAADCTIVDDDIYEGSFLVSECLEETMAELTPRP